MTEQITDKLAPKLPAYIDFLYGDVYNDMDKSNLRDHKWSVQLRSLFQYQNLVNAAVREVKMNQRVLQMGATFGNELDQIAQRVGAYGCFDVIDINQHQVDRCLEKYGDMYPGMHFHCQDAAEFKTDAPMLWEADNLWRKAWEQNPRAIGSVRFFSIPANGSNYAALDAEKALPPFALSGADVQPSLPSLC